MVTGHGPDIVALAEATLSACDLALVLRELRRREARWRHGSELTYREISDRTGWSLSVIGGYFTGVKLPSTERFDELVQLLGARPLEQGMLAAARERAAEAGPTSEPARAGHRPWPAFVPRTLPAPVAGFVGRRSQLDRLDGLLARGPRAGAAVISAVDGMAGVGKTALAVHWAHRAAGYFPDGQLYVNLRGHDPEEPLSAMDALATLLRGLGIDPASVPRDLGARASLYRRMLAGRKALVLLDNAGEAEQLRLLLPPRPSVAVVTSRVDLSGLITVDRALRVTLDVLPEDDAVTLFGLLVGERADQERDVVRTLAQRCGHLPLALRVAAEHAAFRSAARLADLVEELDADASGGLDALGAPGDERADPRAVFSWSLRRLPEEAARAFRLMGLPPGNDVDEEGLAALAGVEPHEARRLADALVRAHLVQVDGDGRLSMHDLLRAYAREAVDEGMSPQERRLATTRLLDHYLTAATVAVRTEHPGALPGRYHNRPSPVQWSRAPSFTSVQAASEWLAAERENMVQACVHAARHGWPEHAVALALALGPFLDGGHYDDALMVHAEALQAARELGGACDPLDAAYLDLCVAFVHVRTGNLDSATERARRALAACEQWDCAEGVSSSLTVLGGVEDTAGRFQEAVGYFGRALDAARHAGNRGLESAQLGNLGMAYAHMEDFTAAADCYQQAADHAEALGLPLGVAEVGSGLAIVYMSLGRWEDALTVAQRALEVQVEFGRWPQSAELMTVIADICRKQGRLTDAVEQLTDALAVCRAGNYPTIKATVLSTLGDAHADAADHDSSAECHREALELAEQSGDRLGRARALAGLGDACSAAGDAVRAREYWQQAHHLYVDMGLPAAQRVQARLDGG